MSKINLKRRVVLHRLDNQANIYFKPWMIASAVMENLEGAGTRLHIVRRYGDEAVQKFDVKEGVEQIVELHNSVLPPKQEDDDDSD